MHADFGWLRRFFRAPPRARSASPLVLALLAAGLQLLIPVLSQVIVDDVIAEQRLRPAHA